MDRKSIVLFSLLGIALAVSIGATYYRYMVRHDYVTFLDAGEIPSPWDLLK